MGSSGRVALVTLTLDPANEDFASAVGYYAAVTGRGSDVLPAASLDYVRTIAWPRFRTYLAREFGTVPWMRSYELTGAGVAHVHVALRVSSLADFWRLRLLVRGSETDRNGRRGVWRRALGYDDALRGTFGLAERAGFGIVSDVQIARDSGEVVRYVTKSAGDPRAQVIGGGGVAYAVKGAADLRMPKRTRRVSWSGGRVPWSPGWRRPVAMPGGFVWRVAKCGPDTAARSLAASGYELTDPALFRAAADAGGAGVVWPAVPAGGA